MSRSSGKPSATGAKSRFVLELSARNLVRSLLALVVATPHAAGDAGITDRRAERAALSWTREVQLALLPRSARKHVAPAGLWPAATCDIPTQDAAGLSSAATRDIPTQDAAAPKERRVPHACEASSASRTIRSVDSAARRAGPASSTKANDRVNHGTAASRRAVVNSRSSASTCFLAARGSTWHPPACSRRRPVTSPHKTPPTCRQRRSVTSPHKTPPLQRSGGCHMLAKQAVLAEPSAASTARPEGPVPPAAQSHANARITGPPPFAAVPSPPHHPLP
jgi:hypothetical protein